MIIQPNDLWRWSYDAQSDRLMLDLSDQMLFATEYRGKQLVPAAFTSNAFCVDDAALYYSLLEQVQVLDWSAPAKVQLILNAVAVRRFYKPLMPQSWYFREYGQSYPSTPGALVIMECEEREALFMVVEEGEYASVCINLEQELMLAGHKSFPRFAVIKVMNNRLRDWEAPEISLAQAG